MQDPTHHMPEPGIAAKQTTGLHDSQKEVSQMTSSDTTTRHPIVLSPTLDAATVESTRWLIKELRSDGHSVEQVADFAAEHLADTVALYGPDVPGCVCETGVGVTQCTVHTDYDPTDAELEQAWNGPDAPEAHRVAWQLHQELRS